MEQDQKPTVEQVLAGMAEKMGEVPRPMVLMSRVAPQAVLRQAADQKFVFEQPQIPMKYKTLMMIVATVAMGNEKCAKTQIIQAKRAGITKEEIGEAILLARYALASTSFNTVVDGLELLVGSEDIPSNAG